MDHLLLKATAVVTDEGVFTAVISTAGVDREKDIVDAPAMVAALRKWNRPIPLAWNHSTSAKDIFGTIDQQTVEAQGAEVVATGQVDLASEVGKEAWRSFKSRTIGFSFGYMILAATERKGGGRHITELDVFEVTATPTPMNNETRVLSTKTVLEVPTVPGDVPAMSPLIVTETTGLTQELQETKALLAKATEELEALRKAEVTDKEPVARSVDPLRKQAEAVALEFASGGRSLRKPPRTVPPRRQDPELSLDDLKRRMRDEILIHLSGGITP